MSADVDTLKHEMMELQSQIAFQEDAISSLDSALALQQQEILLLRRQVELLRARQKEYETNHDAGSASAPQDEKPPHY
jgi:SlyX protein